MWLAALMASGLALFTATLFLGLADLWWPATVLLFGPRWVLLLPFVPLTALVVYRDRTLLIPVLPAVMLMIGPVIGFNTGWRGLLATGAEADLVVASFNAAGGRSLHRSASQLFAAWDADVVMIQECGPDLGSQIRSADGWHVATRVSLCAVSRFPILDIAMMDRDALQSIGGAALVVTFTVDGPRTPIRITNLHLETPRDGLDLIRRGRVREGAEILRQKSLLREIELRRAERGAREAGAPGIVMGDFNTPPESRHLRAIWTEWTNAFSVAGFGIGGTRLSGWIRARIDHVMVDEHWIVVDAWVGEDVGSDHAPIFARIRFRGAPRP